MFQILKLVGLIGLAVWLLFSYTKPTWVEIGEIKSDTNDHTEALMKVSQFNSQVVALQSRRDSLAKEDLDRMDVFMPKSIDEIGVMADIQVVVERHKASLITVGVTDWTGGGGSDASDSTAGLRELSYQSKIISISIEATYEQFKDILVDLERSLVLLEVVSVSFEATEEDIVNYQLTIRINQIV